MPHKEEGKSKVKQLVGVGGVASDIDLKVVIQSLEELENLDKLGNLDKSEHWKGYVTSDLKVTGGRYEEGTNYTIEEKIGEGSYGAVSRAKDLQTGKLFTIKQVQAEKLNIDEVSVPTWYRHTRIPKQYGCVWKGKEVRILQQYLKDGSIDTHLFKDMSPVEFTEKFILNFIKQGAQSVEFLGEHGLVHRDIKPANVCLDGKNFYLIDYGFVTSPKKGVARAGSLIFMAPEVLLNNEISSKNDVWGLAVVAYQMAEKDHKLPWHKLGQFNPDTIRRNMYSMMNGHLNSLRPKYSRLKPLLKRMLNPKPTDRISATGILQHPSITELNKDDWVMTATEDKDDFLPVMLGDFHIGKDADDDEEEGSMSSGVGPSEPAVETVAKVAVYRDGKLMFEQEVPAGTGGLYKALQDQVLAYTGWINFQLRYKSHAVVPDLEINPGETLELDVVQLIPVMNN